MKFILFLFLFVLKLYAQRITILHTNDHHGHFLPNSEGHYGLAAQSTLINQIREDANQSKAHVLLVSAGDINTGTAESKLFNAAPDIEAMNKMGYLAMSVGNHEFDNGFSALKKQELTASFPYLSANIFLENGEPAFKSHITYQAGDKKIAIIGLTTPDTYTESLPDRVKGLTFESPFKRSRELIKELKKSHDMVIVLSHLGFYPNENHGLNSPGDITLAKEIPEIDVIVGGHTHTELQAPYREGKTLIVQANESGHFLGKLDLEIKDGSLVFHQYQLIPVQNVIPDPTIVSLLKPYQDEAFKKFSKIIAYSSSTFDGNRGLIDKQEKPIGNLVAESHKNEMKADFSVVNSKGIRAGLSKGDITVGQLMNISPFGNYLGKVGLNGEELYSTLQTIYDQFITQGQHMYFSSQFSFEIKNGKIINISLNGTIIERKSTKKTTMAMNDFLAFGGGGFPDFRNHPHFKLSEVLDVQALENYVYKRKKIRDDHFIHQTYNLCNSQF
jgi:5'-nucleotidase/UDP-sugar diphosphatase